MGRVARRVTILAVTLAIAGYLAFSGVRYAQLYEDMVAAKTLILAVEGSLRPKGLDVTLGTLDVADPKVQKAANKFRKARNTLNRDPLLWLGKRLPWLGQQISAATSLSEIGVEASSMANQGIGALRIANEIKARQEGTAGEKAVALLEAIKPHMEAFAESLAAIRRSQKASEKRQLVRPLANIFRELAPRLDQAEDIVETYQDAEAFLPQLLGYDKPMTYLILTQDNTELFPTGGLISVYGLVTLERGRVTQLTFTDVGQLWAHWQSTTGEYVEPPSPLRRYLLRDWSWNLGTSNWSPDFPTAAQQAQVFLAKGGGEPVDGVIGMNFITLEEFLSTMRPVLMPEYGVTVDARNATEVILEQTHTPRAQKEGKYVFVAKLAEKVVDSLLQADSSRWVPLLETVQRLGEEKQFFFYANDPELQAKAYKMGWAGEVKREASDYLMLVDTSVHSTKLNLVLNQTVDVDIRLDGQGNARHKVTVSYENTLPQWEQGKSQYLMQQMMGGMYGGYLRLLAPRESQLLDLRQGGLTVGVDEIAEEAGKASFGSYFALARGEKTSITFFYITPNVVDREGGIYRYHLLVQKQSGTRAIPLRISVTLPDDAKAVTSEPDSARVQDNRLAVESDLRTDRELSVSYKR